MQVKGKKEEKSPVALSQQPKNGLFKNLLNIDPRSPSNFISRTPITIFRTSSSVGKFNHQELNESLNETNESVDLDILTAAEQESLDSNKDLTEALKNESDEKLDDPRSPTIEIDRTPIVSNENVQEVKKASEENNLIKKIADKLIMTKISNEQNETKEQKKPSLMNEITKKKLKEKNLIYEDDENADRFSTPPKKIATLSDNQRTPLSSVGNSSRRNIIKTSTPKSSKIPVARERNSATRIPRKI